MTATRLDRLRQLAGHALERWRKEKLESFEIVRLLGDYVESRVMAKMRGRADKLHRERPTLATWMAVELFKEEP